MTEKKFPDYSASAVNLTNPQVLEVAMAAYRYELAKMADIEVQIKAAIPQALSDILDQQGRVLADMSKAIHGLIDQFGSYQNIELGIYAVKQRRESTSYTVEGCRKAIPQFAPAVIEEYVNDKKVEGLLKGGLITKEDVAYFAVKTPLVPAYIIR